MRIISTYFSIWTFALFSFALPSDAGKLDLDISELDTKVDSHDVSAWESGSKNQELSSAIVSGLSSTRIKANLVVQPKTTVLNFKFYKYITQYLRTLKGMDSVRLANIIIHYQPYSDDCQGTVSYALVDTRFNDVMDAESHSVAAEKKKNIAKIVGKAKHLVTVDCKKEAFIQFSMNHQVATTDINKMVLCQIVSGIDMVKGKFAKVNIGWLTVPGDSTIYEPFPAQLYYFPRRVLPELQGKSADYSYKMLVKMAKKKYDKEVAMLNKLQQLVDQQNVITNNLESDVSNELMSADTEIKKLQNEIELMDKVIPNKQKLMELKKHISELQKIKKEKFSQVIAEKHDLIEELAGSEQGIEKVEINENSSVDFSNMNL